MATRVTRSASRATATPAKEARASPATPTRKRSAPVALPSPPPQTPPPSKKSRSNGPAAESPYVPPTPRTEKSISDLVKSQQEQGEREGVVLLHPELKFDYSEAKRHLIATDKRWERVMNALPCRPFEGEQSEPFNPFKSLVSSILGQQVSWMAARSIQHKFCRIWAPHLPEKLPPPDSGIPRVEDPFPTAHQLLETPDRRETLRNAGLSYRKVEYVVELAERFADGRLDAKQLWEMEDDQVIKTLIEVRGIGIWTIQMFLIFSMKRQDILPPGDLGIQKNLCRWYSQDPTFVPMIHPRKLVGSPKKKPGGNHPPSNSSRQDAEPVKEKKEQDRLEEGVGKLDELGSASVQRDQVVDLSRPSNGDTAKFEANQGEEEEEEEEEGEKTQEEGEKGQGGEGDPESIENEGFVFPETSNGLTPQALKNRLSGKKIKGAYLTPQEMEELMKPWQPYRSIACWYLWSVTDKE